MLVADVIAELRGIGAELMSHAWRLEQHPHELTEELRIYIEHDAQALSQLASDINENNAQ